MKTLLSRQKSSTACSRAGRSTWAGTWRYCGDVMCGLPPADVFHFRRRDENRQAPAVPPSLAPGIRPWPPHWVAMPGLLACAAGGAHGPKLSSGGSGVIFTTRSPPGSHRPRVAAGCVRRYSSHPCFSLRPVYGPVRATADRYTGGVRRDPNGQTGRRSPGGRIGSGLPRGELGTTVAGASRSGHGEGRTGGVPRCRGAGVDLSSQHDSRARSQYVKGPRPWWRRRPP